MATNAEDIVKIDPTTLDGAAQLLRSAREKDSSEAPAEETPAEEAPAMAAEDGVEETPEAGTDTPVDSGKEIVEPSDEGDDYVGDVESDYDPTIRAPDTWSGDAKETFQGLPSDIQEQIVNREKVRESGLGKKFQETAELKKQAEAELDQVHRLRSELEQRVSNFSDEQISRPDASMLDINSESYDPDQYHLQMAQVDSRKETQERARAESRKMSEEKQAEDQTVIQRQIQEHGRILGERFPSWKKDPERGAKAVRDIRDYLVTQGVDRAVADNVFDANMITIAFKAKQYDAMKAKEASAKKTVAPKGSKPSTRRSPLVEGDAKKLRANLKDTGSMDDAVALLRATK